MKKSISVILSFVILISIICPATIHAQTVCDCDETPIIYVRGKAGLNLNKHITSSDEENPQLPYVPDGFIEEALKELVPIYTLGYITDDFSKFKERFVYYMTEAYKGYALDKDGNVPNESGLPDSNNWRFKQLKDIHKASTEIDTPNKAKNEVYKYFFQYDCRVDPFESADELYQYILAVKEVTGHQKIKVLARCLGSCILSAYLSKYGWDDIEDVIIYNPVMNGTAITNALFNGEFYFDADAVDFFATQMLDETLPFTLLKEIITMSNKLNGLDMTMAYFNKTATKVARYCIPDVLRVSYGSTPGYWSMVSADVFESARDYIFEGVEDEYAGLIEKINNYHYNVGNNLNTMYKQMEKDGVNVYIIAKYGYQLYPVIPNADKQSDQIVTCEQQAPFTTVAPIGKTLSDEYINSVINDGNGKYISPDKAIDSSTSLFPDTTWYIKNFEHNNFPDVVDELIYKIFRSEEKMTVFTDERYPQYLIYEGKENNGDSIVPMTDEYIGETIKEPGFFELLFNIIKNIFKLLQELISSKVVSPAVY